MQFILAGFFAEYYLSGKAHFLYFPQQSKLMIIHATTFLTDSPIFAKSTTAPYRAADFLLTHNHHRPILPSSESEFLNSL
jgi:hypothetical protein